MRVHLLFPGDPAQRTGGYLYNARMVAELRGLGHEVVLHRVDGAVPDPGPGVVLADGLLWTDLGAQGAALAARRPVAVLLHSPLWREQGASRRAEEEAALAPAALVVATSHRTAGDLDVDAVVVEPGTDPAPAAVGSGGTRWLCVGTITPRKGHDVLLDALSMRRGTWSVRCAGSADRDPAWGRAIRERAGADVVFLGELDGPTLAAEYAAADAVVHPARYEGWGMGLAEALVRRLPVVTTPAGVLDRRDPDAVIRVPPGDPAALAAAMDRVEAEPGVRAALRDRAAALHLPGWTEQARRLAAALEAL